MIKCYLRTKLFFKLMKITSSRFQSEITSLVRKFNFKYVVYFFHFLISFGSYQQPRGSALETSRREMLSSMPNAPVVQIVRSFPIFFFEPWIFLSKYRLGSNRKTSSDLLLPLGPISLALVINRHKYTKLVLLL